MTSPQRNIPLPPKMWVGIVNFPEGGSEVAVTNFPAVQEVNGALAITNFPSTYAVSGALTDAELRASALHAIIDNFPSGFLVSGTVAISNLPATQPVSAASLPLPSGASSEATLALIKAKTDNLDVALSTRAVTGLTDAQLRASPVPISNGVLTPSSLAVTATAAVNTGSTLTLPAAGSGLFHYITSIQLVKLYAVVGTASAAGVIITSTNLPGNPSWTTEQAAGTLGQAPRVIDLHLTGNPLKSSVANTATTLVAPAQAQTIWRWVVTYYTGT